MRHRHRPEEPTVLHHPDATSQFAADRRSALLAGGSARRAARRPMPAEISDEAHGDPCAIARLTAAIPPPGTTAFAVWAADFGERIAVDGVAAHEFRVRALVTLGRHVSGEAISATIAGDRTQPAVARERALGRLLVTLSATSCPSAAQRVA